MKKIMSVLLVVLVALAISIGITTLLVKGVCWAFGITFSMKLVIGIWLIECLVKFCVSKEK